MQLSQTTACKHITRPELITDIVLKGCSFLKPQLCLLILMHGCKSISQFCQNFRIFRLKISSSRERINCIVKLLIQHQNTAKAAPEPSIGFVLLNLQKAPIDICGLREFPFCRQAFCCLH